MLHFATLRLVRLAALLLTEYLQHCQDYYMQQEQYIVCVNLYRTTCCLLQQLLCNGQQNNGLLFCKAGISCKAGQQKCSVLWQLQ